MLNFEGQDAEDSDKDTIMIFEAEYKPAVLIATRMHSARTILLTAISCLLVPGEAVKI